MTKNENNVTQLMEPKMMVGWDVTALNIIPNDPKSSEVLEKTLNEGYEPFAVIPMAAKVNALDQQPRLIEKMWLKRPSLISSEKVI